MRRSRSGSPLRKFTAEDTENTEIDCPQIAQIRHSCFVIPRHSAFGFRHSLNVRVIRGIRGSLLPPSCPFACQGVALREGGWLAPKNRKNFACSRGSKSNTSS